MKLEIQRTDDDTKTRFVFSGEVSIGISEITTMHQQDVEFLQVLGRSGFKGSESLVALALLFSAAEEKE